MTKHNKHYVFEIIRTFAVTFWRFNRIGIKRTWDST